MPFGDYQQVPLLLRAVVARQFQLTLDLDVQLGESRRDQDVHDERFQRPHVLAAGDGASDSGVYLPCLLLPVGLRVAAGPETLHGLLKALINIHPAPPEGYCLPRRPPARPRSPLLRYARGMLASGV